MVHVLVMEDDLAVGAWIADVLQDEGHSVDVYSSVSEARVALASERYDILITDIFIHQNGRLIPDGGISLIGWVRNPRSASGATQLRDLPIIAISGATIVPGQDFLLKVAETIGADCSMTKPISKEELCERVAAMTSFDQS